MTSPQSLGDQPAFPMQQEIPKEHWHQRDINLFEKYASKGMTYRQWLIGMAMQGLCACSSYDGDLSISAIMIADRQLIALAKETEAKEP